MIASPRNQFGGNIHLDLMSKIFYVHTSSSSRNIDITGEVFSSNIISKTESVDCR